MRYLSDRTFPILKIIGSPFTISRPELNTVGFSELYYYAEKNRMRLLYLDSVGRLGRIASLERERNMLADRYLETVEAFSRLGKVLGSAGIEYAFFKTIRPYREVTVDMDVLIFNVGVAKVSKILNFAGYRFMNVGPISATFRDDKADLNIDIYDEVGASRMIYLDKDLVRDKVIDKQLPNGEVVRSLDLCAELLAVISHSIVKEHMYVLSEYYTTLYTLAGMNNGDLKLFPTLVEECRLRSSVKTHLGITALLHYKTHNSTPPTLVKLLGELGVDNFEFARIEELKFKMPYKYQLLTIAKAVIEKFGEAKAKRSFAFQASSMLNPQFTSIVIRETIRRRARESY